MKLFTDAGVVKDCTVVVCSTLFSNFPNGKQIVDEVTKFQLADSTYARRPHRISADMIDNVTDELVMIDNV